MRLLFLLSVLIPACDSSNPPFLMMYSAYMLNRHSDDQRSICQHPLDHRESKGIPEKTSTSASLTRAFHCVDHNKLWKILRDGTTRVYLSPERLSPEEELKSLLMRVEGKNEKSWLKLTFKKLKSWHPVPPLHGKQRGEKWK